MVVSIAVGGGGGGAGLCYHLVTYPRGIQEEENVLC